MPDRGLTKHQAAVLLGFHPETLADPDFRQRIGLPAVRIGRHLRFLESDVKRVIERGREHFPGEPSISSAEGQNPGR